MKTIKLFAVIVVLTTMFGCSAGHTSQSLTGDESGLPPELKGLRVYSVSTGD